MHEDIITKWLKPRSLSQDELLKLARFQELVLAAPMNLTAIKDDENFAIKHFIDSFTLLPWVDNLAKAATFLDIGTGAGFPGVPIKIVRPDLNVTLLDSLLKRVLFLRKTMEELRIVGVECVHARVEDFKKKRNGHYDFAVARAVASLDKLVDYALPLVKPGGKFLAMKGPDAQEEIKQAMPAIDRHGAVLECVESVDISPGMGRTIIAIRVQ